MRMPSDLNARSEAPAAMYGVGAGDVWLARLATIATWSTPSVPLMEKTWLSLMSLSAACDAPSVV